MFEWLLVTITKLSEQRCMILPRVCLVYMDVHARLGIGIGIGIGIGAAFRPRH